MTTSNARSVTQFQAPREFKPAPVTGGNHRQQLGAYISAAVMAVVALGFSAYWIAAVAHHFPVY